MKAETIKNIFNFLNEKEGQAFPKNWNLIERLETHPDGTQYKYDGMLDKLHVEGNLILTDTSISELPDELYVAWNVFIDNTPLDKYPYDQIYEMFNSKGRVVRGKIF